MRCLVDRQTPPPHVRSAPPLPGEARALRANGRLRASPTGMAKTRGCVPVNAAHSLSFATLSSSLREGAKGTSCQREAKSLPYGYGGNHSPTATNERHPLRQPVRAACSPRGGAKGTSCQREAASLPYGCGGNHAPTATNAGHPLDLPTAGEGVCKIIPRLSGSQPR